MKFIFALKLQHNLSLKVKGQQQRQLWRLITTLDFLLVAIFVVSLLLLPVLKEV